MTLTEQEKIELRIRAARAVGLDVPEPDDPRLDTPGFVTYAQCLASLPDPLTRAADCEALLVATQQKYGLHLQASCFLQPTSDTHYFYSVQLWSQELSPSYAESDNSDTGAAFREAVTRACVAACGGVGSTSNRTVYRNQQEQIEALQGQVAALRKALEEISIHYGKVCENFELCEHPACASSYGAWEIADEGLKDTDAGKREAAVIAVARALRQFMRPVVTESGILYYIPEIVGETFFDAVDALDE